jgi:hypothetical protein
VPEAAQDPASPCASRVRDALLGGRRNLAADRDLAAVLEARYPELPALLGDAREFTVRAVTWAARQGIAGYVAYGAGLPLPGAVHEAAQAVIPSARVAYACDPGDASGLATPCPLAACCPGVVAACAPGPAALLGSPALAAVLDLGEPACVVLPMIVHLMDAADARDMVAGVAAALAPGSAVVLSAGVPDATAAGDALIVACAPGGTVRRHPPAVIAGWLEAARLEVVPPGVADVRGWRAGMPVPRLPGRRLPARAVGVVARVRGLGGAEPGGGALVGAPQFVGVGGDDAGAGDAVEEAAGVGELLGEPH